MNRRRRNRNNIIKFPARRGPFIVTVLRKDVVWLVTCKSYSWLHGDKRNAIADARYIARTHGVAVRVLS